MVGFGGWWRIPEYVIVAAMVPLWNKASLSKKAERSLNTFSCAAANSVAAASRTLDALESEELSEMSFNRRLHLLSTVEFAAFAAVEGVDEEAYG